MSVGTKYNKNAVDTKSNGASLSTEVSTVWDAIKLKCVKISRYSYNAPLDISGYNILLTLACRLGPGAFVCGGAVSSCFYGNLSEASDIDVFFDSLPTMLRCMDFLFCVGYSLTENGSNDAALLKESPGSINYLELECSTSSHKIQLIKRRWHPTCEDVLDSFDLVHCMIGLDSEGSLYAHPLALQAADQKVLLVASTAAVNVMVKRIAKYKNRGFRDTHGELKDYDKYLHLTKAEPASIVTPPVASPVVVDKVYSKFDDPEYLNDYTNLTPQELNRKWKDK